jgi:hypothetical protein
MNDSSTVEPLHIRTLQQPTGWQERAACLNRPYEWFEIPDHITPGTLKDVQEDLERGITVCQGCPVRAACSLSSTPGDTHWTVRGGEWPQGLSRRPVGRPVGYRIPSGELRSHSAIQEAPASFPSGPCRRGHDRALTGVTGQGRCYACRKDVDYRLTHPEAPAPLLRPVWEYMDQCPNWHELGPVAARTGPFCPTCRVENNRARVERARQKLMADPVRRAEDLARRRITTNAARAKKRALLAS